jgi:hypothetical protein
MARSSVPSRRMLFSSLGLLAGALLSAGALTACGAPTPTTPGLFVPAATSIDPASAVDTDVMDTGSMTMTMTTPTMTTPTTTPSAITQTTVPAHTATHAVPARKAPKHTATTHTATTKKRPATVHTTKKAAPPAHSTGACSANYYRNSSGNCVHRPVSAPSGPPAGATAKCKDGTYSFSQHHSGTCSGHHGVAEWL